MTGAQRILQKYGKGAGASALAPKTNYASLYYSEEEKRRQEDEKNKGGALSGVKYLGEKLGLGFMQSVEGIWDYAAGGVSSLLGEMGVKGAQDYAERQFQNDWMNYNHADEWFNPGEGWKVAGDVAGGVGTSIPSQLATAAAVGITYLTGGTAAPVAAGLVVAGLSAAGTATKEAYQQTGELGAKEYGYGAIMGGIEAGMEYLTGNVLGTGLKKTADITTSLLGKGAKSVANSIGKSAAFGVAKEFASEAFEEGFSEFISPYMKRFTYDPNAENATAEEIGYAALVGGLSGVIMGGAQTIGARSINTVKGAKEIKSGNVESIRAEGKVFAEEGFMKEDYAETVRSIESQLKALEGNESGLAKLKRARLVGELKTATTNGVLSGMVQRSGMTVVENADAVAERLNADGRYKMVDGRFTFVENTDAIPEGADVRDITAEDLTKGYDSANGKDAMAKALKKNEALRYVAASDAAGRFMMTAKQSADAALRGEKIRNEAEYKRLRESASAEERAAISRELGVDVNTASFEQFNEAVGQFKESGRADAYKQKTAKIGEIKAKANDRAYNIPKAIALADGGVKRFSDADNNIAVARMGDSFIIYDYNTGLTTRNMTRAEVNAELARYRNERTKAANARAEAQKNATTETAAATGQTVTEGNTEGAADIWEKGVTEADRKAATEARKQAAELDSYAKEKIKDYDHLSAANKTMVRDVIREARAKGLSDADALSYARVSARTGLDIAFDKEACLVSDEDGNKVYYAGFYDPDTNKIVVNPETTKKHAALLIHELSHATRAYTAKDGQIHYIFDDAYTKISDDMRERIVSAYADQDVNVSKAELVYDEATAYYAEALFGTERAVELLLGEKPTLKQKILSFFTKSAAYYSTDEKLSREARRHFKKFKAMFDSFAARNAGRNAEVVNEIVGKSARMATNYGESLEQLNKGTFDVKANTHIRVLEHTPKIFMDKADAADRKIIMSWDVAFLAMKRREDAIGMYRGVSKEHDQALDMGNYHGLGVDVLNKLPKSLEDPLYIVKQKDGRIAAVTEIVVKNGRSVFVSIELDAYKTTIEDGKSEAQKYNLIVTVMDARSRYLKNTVFTGDVVYNKNNEDPAHFILRLNTLKKLMPTYDLAGSSKDIISDPEQKINPSDENSSKKSENSARRNSMEPTATVESGEGKAELPRKAERANMTVGQLKKFLANYSRAKTYSRKDALGVVEKIDAGKALSESTRNDIAEAVWQIYNEAMTTEERYAAAQDIANYFTLKLFAESKIDNPDAKKAQEDLVYLSAGIGSLSFTEQQKNEIKHREDADGLKSIIGRWGFKGERTRKNGTIVKRTPLDVFVVDIAREMPGMQYLEDMNPVDAFLQINQVYTATREIALDKQMSAYWDVPESEIEGIKTSIENDIMQGYIDSGTKSKFASMFQSRIAFYEKQAERYKNEFNEIRGRDKINGMLVSQALKMRDLKIGKFKNATQTQSDTFKKTIESLARIQWRGNISVKSTRKVVKDLYEWYVNPDVKKAFFGYVDEKNIGRYNEGIAALMQELSKDESKKFTKIDLYAMLDVMGYFTNFVETYGKVYRRGQWVDAEAEAKAFIEKIPTAAQKRRGIGNATKTLTDKYLGAFGDPASYIRRMDNYSDGFFTQIFEDLREAAIGSDAQEIELLIDYDEFIEKNKKYLEKAKTETVEYKGVKIPKIQLIGLYMTMKQQQAHAGIAINGFAFVDTDGKEVRVPGGIKQDGEVTEQDIKAYIEEQQKTIEKSLTEADREYIKVVEKGYLAAGQAKAYRDMQKYGFTNVVSDYYYPIKRANIPSNVDKSDLHEELDRVSNASFNKDRVKGAKQELFIDDADKLYRRHIHAVCQYANLSPVIDSYNMLYNYDIGGNPNHPTSIRTQIRNVWPEANSYFMKLISDVQGITHGRGVGMEAIARIRSGYARYQLGANPKTWVTQISSIFAASSLIDSRRVLTPISGKDVDKYCALARIRNYDNAAVKAQAVADSKIRAKTDSIGDALMKPIGAVDRFVIQRLFAACQSQVEADGGAKVGTEENKIAAGKLLTRVILETQQNSIATERSAAMRSDNEIVRSLTMFRADAMKVIGRVIDSYGEVKALSRQLKATSDTNVARELKGKLKKAKKKAARSMLALATTSIYTALIAQLFKWLYAKERDEDESLAEDFITDVIGNTIGGLPLITDAYSYFVEGFDLDNYSYSAVNDFLASAKSILDLADGDFTDEELARNIKNLSYSVGQIFGIPTRNIYNIFYGLTKRISPETGYAIDSVFYEKNYKTDFYKAIEQGDDDMANYILQLLMGERIGDGIGEDTYKTILDLSNKGYKILPKTVPNSVTVDGVEYDLGEDDIASVKALYGEYAKGIDDLVKSSYYANLSDEKRCEAISYYYDLSRDKAIYDALGYDRGSKVKIADLVGMENLVKLQIATKGIESDKDRDGNTVAGSKRAKVVKAIKSIKGTRTEKVLMIFAAGYTVKDGDIPGVSEASAKKMLLSAIMKLKVSKEEKAEIARSFGFTVKGNRIVRDF